MWFPQKGDFFKQVRLRSQIKFGISVQRVILDTHNTFGIYAAIGLLFLAATAAAYLWPTISTPAIATFTRPPMSAPTQTTLALPPAASNTRFQMLETASGAAPGLRPLAISGGGGGETSVTLGRLSDHAVAVRTTNVTLDTATGAVKAVTTPKQAGIERGPGAWLLALHDGQWASGTLYYGIKVVWFVLGLTPAILLVTGLLMYLRKRRNRREVQQREIAA